nr:replication-relaxation family protein [Fodinicola feengrottensis]
MHDHRVLTTHQVRAALFGSPTTARMRLNRLRRAGLITRFRWHPGTGGSQPWHYTIDDAGAALIAAERELVLASGNALRVRRAVLAASPQLAHRVGANEFFSSSCTRTHVRTAGSWWPGSTRNKRTSSTRRTTRGCAATATGPGARTAVRSASTWSTTRAPNPSPSCSTKSRRTSKQPPPGTCHRTRCCSGSLPHNAKKNLWTAIANTRTRAPRIPIATAARDTSTGGQPASAIWALANAPGRRRRLAELPVAEPLPTPTLAHPRELLDVSILDKTAAKE